MPGFHRPCPSLWICLLLLPFFVSAQWERGKSDELFHFVSRPDLKAPKWNVTVYHEDLVAPGCWFIDPYHEPRGQEDPDDAWVGPHVYDGNGELVWSGTVMFDNGKSTHGFQIHKIRGESLMTLLNRDLGAAVIFDNHYEIRDTIKIDTVSQMNARELHFVDNGTRALVIKTENKVSTIKDAETVGHNGPCHAAWDGIQELDTETWEPVFTWSPLGHIGLNESTHDTNLPIEETCNSNHGGWDFIHANSIDKTSEGDYLFSARHTDTIYKISGKHGSIIWRLGGLQSDFDMGDLKFSRQHHIRFHGYNGSDTLISILDNAKGRDSQSATNECSRGLTLALDERRMTVKVLGVYNHPDRGIANKQSSHQLLPNGNVFQGWSNRALQSEYTSNGTLVMESRLLADWLVSYRNFKFPFIGEPLEPPAVHSAAYGEREYASARTRAYVSWNGATKVATWNFYKSMHDGGERELLGSRNKTGFETMLDLDGYASYVIAEGLDRTGAALGESSVIKTIPHPNMTAAAVEKEEGWLLRAADRVRPKTMHATVQSPIMGFIVGCVSCLTILLLVVLARRNGILDRFQAARYERLWDGGLDAIYGRYQDQGQGETDVESTRPPQELLRAAEKSNERPDAVELWRYSDG